MFVIGLIRECAVPDMEGEERLDWGEVKTCFLVSGLIFMECGACLPLQRIVHVIHIVLFQPGHAHTDFTEHALTESQT